jgi:hypothetical protein
MIPIAGPQREAVALCKAGPVGTYTFDATSSHAILRDPISGVHNLSSAQYQIVVSFGSTIDIAGTPVPGACYDFQGHNHIAEIGGGTNASVTVVETAIPTGIDFDHVLVYQRNGPISSITPSTSTTNSATGLIGGTGSPGQYGATITFFNVPEPPPEGCTYTKGWYQNKNGSPTVIGVDGRTKQEAQAIFAATPGKPGGVTWGINNSPNSLLNLYQQLLAALNNLGGDANFHNGPDAVDQAIDAALAGTGGTGKNITTTLTQQQIGGLTETLASFNEGTFPGWPHCGR